MGWDEHAKLEKSIDTLHETIQKQIKATNKQSNIMVGLTIAILIFTILLFIISVFQIPKLINYEDTKTHFEQTQRNNNKKLAP